MNAKVQIFGNNDYKQTAIACDFGGTKNRLSLYGYDGTTVHIHYN